MSVSVRALECKHSTQNFSRHVCLCSQSLYASIAQLVEQRTENPCVAGSIPARGIKKPVQLRWLFLNILYPF